MRFHFIPVRMSKIKVQTYQVLVWTFKSNKNFYTLLVWIQKWYIHFGKQFGNFLKKVNIYLPYDPASVLLGNYASKMKAHAHTKHMNVDSSFVCNSLKLKVTQITH